jgi:hypothetical protein
MMTKTNSSRFSKLLLGLLLVATVVAVPAGAVSTGNADVPTESEVGTKTSATVTLTELYQNPQLEQWTLAGQTDLENVTWTVTYYDQTGAKVDQSSFDGQNFTGGAISAGDGIAEVDVTVEGTVPSVEAYSYDPAQSFTVLSLEQTREGGTTNSIDSWTARHYTPESQTARDALDDAREEIDAAGDPDDAETKFTQAVDAYESAEFDLAAELAGEAKSQAQSVQQNQQRNQMLLYAGGGLVVLLAIVGGFLWYRSQTQQPDRLG